MSELSNDYVYNNEQLPVNPDFFLGRLENRVQESMTPPAVVELPPEDYKKKLKTYVFGSDEENALYALANEKKKGKKFTQQQEKTFVATYKVSNPIEQRIETAVDALHSAITFLKSQPTCKDFLPYIDVPELLAVMCKETNLNPAAEGTSGEKSYFHITPDRKSSVTTRLDEKKIYIPGFLKETTVGLLGFLMYKKQAMERFSKITQPKLAEREKHKLVWLAHNKGITTTEKIVSLSYKRFLEEKKADPYITRSFDFVYKTLYTMVGFASDAYEPKRKKQKQQSAQFLKLSVIDYGSVDPLQNTPLAKEYPLDPYRASVGLRYMLTIEALIDQLK